jgi:hypothetical protein
MSDLPEPVVTDRDPVAPHLAGGMESEKTPHVGPDLAAYAERRVRDGGLRGSPRAGSTRPIIVSTGGHLRILIGCVRLPSPCPIGSG